MVTMRAKLTVSSVTPNEWSDEVEMFAVYSENKEDNSYAEASPAARLLMVINNPALRGQIKPGQQFYVDFTPVELAQRIAEQNAMPKRELDDVIAKLAPETAAKQTEQAPAKPYRAGTGAKVCKRPY